MSARSIIALVKRNDVSGAEKLLDKYPYLLDECDDSFGLTPLMWAAQEGKLVMTRMLVRRGAALDEVDFSGGTAISHAAWRRRLDIVKYLLSSGADAAKADKSGMTPLMSTCRLKPESPALYPDWSIRDPSFRAGVLTNGLGLFVS
jgi:hypothetical protein